MASQGDRVIVEGHKVGAGRREGTIVKVRGPKGTPPYLVRWDNEDDSEHLFFPGPDAIIRHGG